MPGRRLTLVGDGHGGEAQALLDVILRNGSVLDGRKHLPTGLVVGRAGHEALSTPAVEAVVVPGLAGDVGQTTDGRTLGNVGRVSLGEAQSAVGVNVDLLATGNNGILQDVSVTILLFCFIFPCAVHAVPGKIWLR